jgi:hypothetical protein
MEQMLNTVRRYTQDLTVMPIAVKYDSNEQLDTHAPVVAVVGGLFTGVIVAAQRQRTARPMPAICRTCLRRE